jgi:DNA repair protein RecO (recombination protein O)
MPNRISVNAIVLSVTPVGEADKSVTLLSREHGKLSAFAKGARKPTAHLAAATEPFVFGLFHIILGKSSNQVVGVDVGNYFEPLRGDVIRTCYGLYLCEFAMHMSAEGVDETDAVKLLYRALEALAKGVADPALIRAAYEMKLMQISGYGASVDRCMKCGCVPGEKMVYFSVENGGIICEDCAKQWSDMFPVTPAVFKALNFVSTADAERTFGFTLSAEALAGFSEIVEAHRRYHIGVDMRSQRVLEDVLRGQGQMADIRVRAE